MNEHNEDMLNNATPVAPARPRPLKRAAPRVAAPENTVTDLPSAPDLLAAPRCEGLPADAAETCALLAPEPDVSAGEGLEVIVAAMELEAPLPELPAGEGPYADAVAKLIGEARQAERARLALEETMERVRAADPERLSMLQSEIDRQRAEIMTLQRELAAQRRATQIYGNASTRGYWLKMGQGLEESAEEVFDALDRADAEEVMTVARRLATEMVRFGGECTAFGEVLR